MIAIRRSSERGHFDHGWLSTFHTFSFSDYYDPKHMGFRHLRVINQDTVSPGEGFGTHGHRDMEIISYVLEGALEHKDSMGTGSVIRPGDVQYMSAGSGVTHSEFNHSESDPVHFMQIWIFPNVQGAKPQYAQQQFGEAQKLNKLCLIVSPDGAHGSIAIRQDAKIYASIVEESKQIEFTAKKDRHYWIQALRGSLKINTQTNEHQLQAGDGAAISGESELKIAGSKGKSEFLFFDLN